MSTDIDIPEDQLVSLLEALRQPEDPAAPTTGEQAPSESTKSSDDIYADDDEGLDIGTDQPEAQPTPAQEAPETPQPGIERGEIEDAPQRQLEATTVKSEAAAATESSTTPREWEGQVHWLKWAHEETDTNPEALMQAALYDLFPASSLEEEEAIRKRVWKEMVARTHWRDGKYWFLNDNGRWEAYSKEDLHTILKGTRLFRNVIGDPGRAKGWQTLKFEAFQRRILTKNTPIFVGEIAGRKKGVTEWKEEKYLITKGPTIIEPKEGECPIIEGVLGDQFAQGMRQVEVAEARRRTEATTSQTCLVKNIVRIPPGWRDEYGADASPSWTTKRREKFR